MRRRNFLGWMAGAGLLSKLPAWAQGPAPGVLGPLESANLQALAAVVLPASLGGARRTALVEQFLGWCRNYREDADLGYGYGHPRTRRSGPNPARQYPAQLRALGTDFAALGAAERRARVEAALAAAGAKTIPRRPNGRHVASDLMGWFFNGAAGEDFLLQARVMRDACRGLEGSDEAPKPLAPRPGGAA